MYETFCENCSHFVLKWFQSNTFGEMCFLEESYENMQKNQILKFWERPLFDIREYAFKREKMTKHKSNKTNIIRKKKKRNEQTNNVLLDGFLTLFYELKRSKMKNLCYSQFQNLKIFIWKQYFAFCTFRSLLCFRPV